MTEREKLEQAIAIQESMRGTMPDDVIDVTIAAIRRQLAELAPSQTVEERKQITAFVRVNAESNCMSVNGPLKITLSLSVYSFRHSVLKPTTSSFSSVTCFFQIFIKAIIPAFVATFPALPIRRKPLWYVLERLFLISNNRFSTKSGG